MNAIETLLSRPQSENPFQVGNTPLLPIARLNRAPGVSVYAKAEWLNPGGSVKDRPAAKMIEQGLREKRLLAGTTLLDASSGNTGIAYARIGARLGCRVKLAVPASINPARKKVLLAYGAQLVLTDPLEGSDGAILEAKRLYALNPGAYFFPDQYNNPANWRAHYETTGPEILAQTEGALTHFVAGLGTSGTFCGTGRRLKEEKPSVRLISVQPDGPMHGLEGLKHMETAIVPGIYDAGVADEEMFIETEEAQKTALRAAREEGLLIGPSGGANLAACLRLAGRLGDEGRKAVIVTVFPDGGERYLEDRFWRVLP